VPETYTPVILKWKAQRYLVPVSIADVSADYIYRLRKTTGKEDYYSSLDLNDTNLLHAIVVSCYKPFRTWYNDFCARPPTDTVHKPPELMFFDRMALLLNIWTALLLGILYLTFQAFPIIFETNHGFNEQSTGLSFLGIGFGMIAAISSQPLWNRSVIAYYTSLYLTLWIDFLQTKA